MYYTEGKKVKDDNNGVIISFSSRSSVFSLHEGLKKENVNSKIISTPAIAKMACGLSVEIDGKFYLQAVRLAARLGLRITAVFVAKKSRNGVSYVRIQNLQ
ncbi:MAG: DUF3343 domain-containing protein [Clostridia bacterium]|nr:DUF3343 domain-containing protein [Clostridia bacterium]